MRVCSQPRIFLLLGVLVGGSPAASQELRLFFHQIDSNSLSLRIHHSGSESWLAFDQYQQRFAMLRQQGAADVRATVGPFDVHGFYDPSELLKNSRTDLDLFIRHRDSSLRQILSTQCEIRVVSSDYSDLRAEILFDIAEGESFYSGRLQLLLPLLKPESVLVMTGGDHQDLEIELFPFSRRVEEVELANVAANYSLQLGEPTVDASDDWMWASEPSLQVIKSTFYPGEQEPASLTLSLRPSLLRVVAPVIKKSHRHTDLAIEIPFRVEPGPAQQGTVRQRIHVRFRPHWALVGLWTAVVAAICSLVWLRRTPASETNQSAARSLFDSAFVALVAYGFISLAAEGLSVQLHPGDYRTALLVGGVVGLAPRNWPKLLGRLTGLAWALLQWLLGRSPNELLSAVREEEKGQPAKKEGKERKEEKEESEEKEGSEVETVRETGIEDRHEAGRDES